MPGTGLQRFPVNRPVRGGIRRRGRVRKELATLKIGLVLEGGGMRGLYTVGVLDWLMEKQFMADYVIGVSAGAGNGSSYVSGQRGRSYRVDTAYLEDKRYVSLYNFIKTKSVFGMDFIFDIIPKHLDPFDYPAFLDNPCEFITGVTDVHTGEPVYFGKQPDLGRQCKVLRASASIPLFAPPVTFQGGLYLDGGTSDPIPVRRALADGCDRVIVVLTRDREYVKQPESFRHLYHRQMRKYPKMIEALDRRHEVYNETRRYVDQLEKEGTALVVAPSMPLSVSRFEKNKENLNQVYRLGHMDAENKWRAIEAWAKARQADCPHT